MRLRRLSTDRLPVLDPGIAREVALRDAGANGTLAAQQRTRAAVRSGVEAWVGLLGARSHEWQNTYRMTNAAGDELNVYVTVKVAPANHLTATR